MVNKKLNNGFTLIELLISMAVLGILAAVAMPAYNGYLSTARMAEAKNNLAALRLAEEEYFLENNQYFEGSTIDSTLATASGGLWTATKGSDGYSFDYVVTLSYSWTATAFGRVGTKVDGKTETISK